MVWKCHFGSGIGTNFRRKHSGNLSKKKCPAAPPRFGKMSFKSTKIYPFEQYYLLNGSIFRFGSSFVALEKSSPVINTKWPEILPSIIIEI